MLKLYITIFSVAVLFTSVGSASSLENILTGNQIAEGKSFTVKISTDKNDINGEKTKMKNRETAVLGAGCFWCVEAIFQKLKGVISVEPGYTGGTVANPTYDEVCSGKTGHAEVAKIVFNKKKISYGEILDVFFEIHDPTTLNRQGNDIGEQYRSAIFYACDKLAFSDFCSASELTRPNPSVRRSFKRHKKNFNVVHRGKFDCVNA